LGRLPAIVVWSRVGIGISRAGESGRSDYIRLLSAIRAP
jgi:hypothetical protein